MYMTQVNKTSNKQKISNQFHSLIVAYLVQKNLTFLPLKRTKHAKALNSLKKDQL